MNHGLHLKFKVGLIFESGDGSWLLDEAEEEVSSQLEDADQDEEHGA